MGASRDGGRKEGRAASACCPLLCSSGCEAAGAAAATAWVTAAASKPASAVAQHHIVQQLMTEMTRAARQLHHCRERKLPCCSGFSEAQNGEHLSLSEEGRQANVKVKSVASICK